MKELLTSIGGPEDENGEQIAYIGMPISVPFDKDIGLRKKTPLVEQQRPFSGKNSISNLIDSPEFPRGRIKPTVPKCTCKTSHHHGSSHRHTDCKSSFCKPCPLHPSDNVPHHKKVNNILESRKQIYSSYTKIDPEVRKKVQADIQLRSKPVRNADPWQPNKYVIEQIRPSGSFDRSKVSTKRAKISLSTERIPRFSDISGTGTVQNIALLTQMVELMDQAMQQPIVAPKPPVSVSYKDESTQADLSSQALLPKPEETPSLKPASAKAPIQKPRPATKPQTPAPVPAKPIQVRPAPKPPASFLALAKPPRTVKEVSKSAKIVRIVQREYELDRESFEISELVNHVPSRVYSLATPLTKTAAKLKEGDDLAAFDREHFTPMDCELVDEHLSELEKRNVYTRTLRNVEIPVVYNHSVKLS